MAGKVTVVGAGFYGSTTAQRIAEYNIVDTVVLTDILDGKAEGLALDMNQSRSIEGFETKIIGATTTADGAGYEATANSDVVVITAGLPLATAVLAVFRLHEKVPKAFWAAALVGTFTLVIYAWLNGALLRFTQVIRRCDL